MSEILYAKTEGRETIRNHTDNLKNELEKLKENYKLDIDEIIQQYMQPEEFWKMIEICCEYHDYGKSNIKFQNKLRKILKLSLIPDMIEGDEVRHEFLSPAFITQKEYDRLGIKKEYRKIIVQSIAYHHERSSIDKDMKIEIENTINMDLKPRLNDINEAMGTDVKRLSKKYIQDISDRLTDSDGYYEIYIMLKGLLHRLDHSASAHEDIEDTRRSSTNENLYDEKNNHEVSIGDATETYKIKKKWEWREPQTFVKENRNKNIILIASTGMGKTETAFLWIDDKKGFFTLPLRVSINALYNRVVDKNQIDFGENRVGLIHSTAINHLINKNHYDDINEIYNLYSQSKLFSKALNFTTVDQIFKYPFKYLGYEKILATLAYSKVVIDEIQAYDPKIAAVILYGIKDLCRIGGKFLIMTATLPRIYKDKLKEFGIDFEFNQFTRDILRHKIKLINDDILSVDSEIIEKSKNSKILIIVNTINKAFDIMKKLEGKCNVRLLHSNFINKDRAKLEKEIKNFIEDENGIRTKETGIWITTQIVEASIDVDFDYLYTEMSTLDSQFQRFGRCYRKREYKEKEANVKIYTDNISGLGYIYNEKIVSDSIDFLKKYNGEFIEENIKIELVDRLYSKENLMGTDFYNDFNNSCNILENIIPYDITNGQAQKLLRDISSIKVIPEEVYNRNINLFDELEKIKDVNKRKQKMIEIDELTMNLPNYTINSLKRVHGNQLNISPIKAIDYISTINIEYNNEFGLIKENLTDNII